MEDGTGKKDDYEVNRVMYGFLEFEKFNRINYLRLEIFHGRGEINQREYVF